MPLVESIGWMQEFSKGAELEGLGTEVPIRFKGQSCGIGWYLNLESRVITLLSYDHTISLDTLTGDNSADDLARESRGN